MSIEWKPHQYQQDTIDFAIERQYAGLFLDPGLGKTSISLHIINHFKEKTLIIAPIKVMYNTWPREIQKWSNFNNIKYTILHGPDKEKRFLKKGAGVYIINPEGLKWLDSMIQKHKYFPFKSLFVDESTKFKSASSKRFKLLARYLNFFTRRYILTGTPVPNTYLDLYGQIYLLDQGATLGKSFYAFRNRYFFQADHQGFVWKMHDLAEDQIRAAVKPFTMHLAAEDNLDMPELVFNYNELDLEPKVRKAYKQMEDSMFAELDEAPEKVVALSAAASSMKCQQMANGFIYETPETLSGVKGERRAIRLHTEKLDALKELVDELQGSPLLVPFWYNEDLKMMQEVWPDVPFIGSGVKEDKFMQIERDWNAGKIPILLIHPMSGGHGLNIQESGHHIFWYSLTYSFELYDQTIRRIWRQGFVGSRVIVHVPYIKKTVDVAIMSALDAKESGQKGFLKALKLYREEIQ